MNAKRTTQVVGTAVGVGLVAAAVGTELRKPRRRRTWHGRVAGVVPYDFRRPTLSRVKARWWNPGDRRVLTPRVFGVGWAVNVGRLVRH
jgi:Family of unknown function (DUF5808)